MADPISMEDQLVQLFDDISIIEAERRVIPITGEDTDQALQNCSLSVFGKILTTKTYTVTTIKFVCRRMWNLHDPLTVFQVGANIFQILIPNEERRKRAVTGGPWLIDGFLFVVQPWNEDMEFLDAFFSRAKFWVQIPFLPLTCLANKMGRKIGNILGKCLEVQIRDQGAEMGRVLRILTEIDISQPLMRYVLLQRGSGSDVRAPVQYERLPAFCFKCGRIGHKWKKCPNSREENLQDVRLTYGKWMCANEEIGKEVHRASLLALKNQRNRGWTYGEAIDSDDESDSDQATSSSSLSPETVGASRATQRPGHVMRNHYTDRSFSVNCERMVYSSQKGLGWGEASGEGGPQALGSPLNVTPSISIGQPIETSSVVEMEPNQPLNEVGPFNEDHLTDQAQIHEQGVGSTAHGQSGCLPTLLLCDFHEPNEEFCCAVPADSNIDKTIFSSPILPSDQPSFPPSGQSRDDFLSPSSRKRSQISSDSSLEDVQEGKRQRADWDGVGIDPVQSILVSLENSSHSNSSRSFGSNPRMLVAGNPQPPAQP